MNKPDDIVLVFDRLFENLSLYNDIDVSATKNCIVFVRRLTFVVAKPMLKCLEIKFYSKELIDDEDLHKCHLWNSKYEGILRIQHETDLKPKYFNYFKNSYLIS